MIELDRKPDQTVGNRERGRDQAGREGKKLDEIRKDLADLNQERTEIARPMRV